MSTWIVRIWPIGLLMLVLAVGCGSPADSADAQATAVARLREGMEGLQTGVQRAMPTTVVMTAELRFEPARLTVPVGATVVWRNDSTMAHTVTADPAQVGLAGNVQLPPGAEPFASEEIPPGGVFVRQLTVAGAYHYVCRLHAGDGMTGVIVVE